MSDHPDPPRWTQPGVELPEELTQALRAGRGELGTGEVSELARRLSAVLGPAAGLPTPDGGSTPHGSSGAGSLAPGAPAPLPATGGVAGAAGRSGANAAARGLSWHWAAALLGGAGLAAAWVFGGVLGVPTPERARDTSVVEASPPDAAEGRVLSVPASEAPERAAPVEALPASDPGRDPERPVPSGADAAKPMTPRGSPVGGRRVARPATAGVAAGGRGEAALLEAAREALATRPARALALTREHAARFPSGALAEEREAIAIAALRRLGRGAAADARAATFERRYRGSVHQPRSTGAKPPAAAAPEPPVNARD